jgi:transcriptional regulator with XRE-family HTH domain
MTSVGNKLRELRGAKSQTEVAKDLNISDSAVSSYENGERMPRPDMMRRIADYYGKTVQEIFFDQ